MYDGSLGIAEHRQPLPKRRIALLVLLCMAPAAVLLLHGRNQPKAGESSPTPAVAVATVRQGDVPVMLQALGPVTPTPVSPCRACWVMPLAPAATGSVQQMSTSTQSCTR